MTTVYSLQDAEHGQMFGYIHYLLLDYSSLKTRRALKLLCTNRKEANGIQKKGCLWKEVRWPENWFSSSSWGASTTWLSNGPDLIWTDTHLCTWGPTALYATCTRLNVALIFIKRYSWLPSFHMVRGWFNYILYYISKWEEAHFLVCTSFLGNIKLLPSGCVLITCFCIQILVLHYKVIGLNTIKSHSLVPFYPFY